MPEALDSAAAIPAQATRDGGWVGVLRYLGFVGDWRRVTRAEIDAHFAAGNAVALIREENGRELLGGEAAGHRLGQQSSQLADELGWPHDRPVYLTQDIGFARSQWGAVRDALGVANTYRPCGFYGGGDLGDWLVDQGVAPVFWLAGAYSWTSTWSGRRWDPNADPLPQIPTTRHAVIAQTPEQPVVGGVTCDRNIVLAPDWGQYHPDQPTPTPTTTEEFDDMDKKTFQEWIVEALQPEFVNQDTRERLTMGATVAGIATNIDPVGVAAGSIGGGPDYLGLRVSRTEEAVRRIAAHLGVDLSDLTPPA